MQNKRQKQSSLYQPSVHKSSLRPQNSRLVLEPRIVFDAALPVAGLELFDQAQMQTDYIAEQPTEIVVASAPVVAAEENVVETNANATQERPTQDRPLIDGTLALANLTATEIIFIDAIVSDLQQYITDHPNADVVLLDSSKDGLAQIAAVLNGRTGIESVHILSHGTSGQLNLGNATINLTVLKSQYSAELAIIQSSLTENADILIYGCDVAAGDAGAAFVGYLASATGADIAASTDLTGAADLGGNWVLETKTATVESASLDLANWNGLLTPVNTGLWAISAAANTATVPVTATNTTDGVLTTVTFSGPNNAWTGSIVEKLITDAAFNTGTTNTASAFSNAAAGIDSIRTVFAGGVTGTVTITFSKPVLNPTIHLDRLGGFSGTVSNSSTFTLTTAGASLTKLSGSGHLLVGGAGANGSTGTTIQRTTGAAVANAGEASSDNLKGTAAGSVVVTGAGGAAQLFTSITFNVTGAADGIEMAFTFDAPPVATNDTFVSVGNATVTGNIVTGNNGGGTDSDFKGDAISMTQVNGTAFTLNSPITLANGTLTITNASTGAFTFVPNPGFSDVQTFTYTIADPLGLASTATVTISADTDGDGVVNSTDLDDDNDGILDSVESRVVPASTISLAGGAERNGTAMTGVTNIVAGDVVRYKNVMNVDGQQVDMLVTVISTTGPLSASLTGFLAVSGQPTNTDPKTRVAISFVLSGTATPFVLPTSGVFTMNDIDSQAADDITEVLGVSQTAFGVSTFGSALQSGGFINSVNATGFDFYRLNPAQAGSVSNWTDEGNVTGDPATNAVFVNATTGFTSGEFIFGSTGGATNSLSRSLNVGTFTLNSYIANKDSDGDGISDHLDLDSDNDGISDLSESTGGTGDALADTNNNGTVSLTESVAAGATGDGDIDNDGLMDIFDANTGNTTGAASLGNTPINTDGDSRANYLDLDSDNDGIADTVEARLTAGYVANDGNTSNNDADKDGVIDIFDSNDGTTRLFGGTFTAPVNTDGADLVDYLDTDSDNDGKLDSAESGLSTVTTDTNGDGIRDSVNASYADPDGLVNNPQANLQNEVGTTAEVAYREILDTDSDGVADFTDLDDDNDGILDTVEVGVGFIPPTQTADGVADNLVPVTQWKAELYQGYFGVAGAPGNSNLDHTTNTVVGAPILTEEGYIALNNGSFSLNDTSIPITDNPFNSLTFTSRANIVPGGFIPSATVNGAFQIVLKNQVSQAGTVVVGAPGQYFDDHAQLFINGTLVDSIIGFYTSLPAAEVISQAVNAGDIVEIRLTNAGGNAGFRVTSTIPARILDADGDGITDNLDLDSDNDGISDLRESTGGTGDALADTNNDGTVSLAESVAAGATGDGDIDNDGLMDIFDANTGNTTGAASLGNTPINTDGDTKADYLDLDSDNDGIADTVEARLTAGYVANDGNVSNNDADKDGVIDIFDSNDGTTKLFGGTFTTPVNTDGTDLVDYLDTDSDNDGKLDSVESGLSTVTTDANNDGIRDSVNASYTDPDGLVNNPQVNLANEFADTTQVAYREVNIAPVNTVPAAQTTLEDTSVIFSTANGNAIQISDANGGLVTVTIWAENGLLTLASTTGLTFSTTTNNSAGGAPDTAVSTGTNDATIRITGTIANINAALNGLRFTPTANTNGSTSTGTGTGVGKISIRTEDDGVIRLADTDSVVINITAVKDTTVDNVSTDEDTAITISPFTNDTFGSGNGFLTAITAPTNGTSVLNVGLGTTTYTPTAGFSGVDSYTYTTTTIDAGFNYQYFNVLPPDAGTYAGTFPTNNFPTAVNGSGWVAGISANDGIRIQEQQNDPDTTLVANFTGVVLIERAGNYNFTINADNAAQLFIDGVAVVNVGWSQGNVTGTVTGLTAGVHTFVLQYADVGGNHNVNLSYSGLDTSGATVNVNNDKHWGAAARTETETINITVNNVNDAPSGADNLNIAGTEDTPVTITAANFGFSDTVDAVPNAFANVIITALPPATEGVYQLNGSNIAINQVISVAQIDAGLLKFVPANGVSGNDLGALGFKVQDNGGIANGGVDTDPTANTLAIDIAPVNDAPAGADKTVTTAEDGAYTFTVADFGFTDPNDAIANNFANVVISTLPPSGILRLNGVAVTAGQVIPAASIGLLTWTPPLNGNGNALSSFTFQVVDNGATGGANQNTDQSPNTITFNVTPVNDAPVDGIETNTVTEDITLTVADGGTGDLLNNATDVDGDTLSITGYTIDGIAGTQAVNTPIVIASGTITINANGSYSFAPAANYTGAIPQITYTVSDGTLTDTSTLTLSMIAVNDDPVDGNETNTLTEDTTLTVADGAPGDLLNNATDTEGNPLTISGFTIAGVAGFQAANTPVVITGVGTITINANGSYSFVPAANYAGTIPLITYTVSDGAGGNDTSTLGLSIVAVNDAPAGTDNTSTVNEDTVYTVTAADFGFTDPNDAVPNTLANVIITSLPADGSGQYQLNGLPIAINQVISAADINAGLLKFVPTPNFNGSGTAALGFQVQDNGGGTDTDLSPNTFKLNITPVDDVVTITGLNNGPAGTGSDAQVKESDLAAGTTPAGTSENATGSFNLGAPSALTSLTINGGATITKADLINSATTPIVRTTANGTLTINSYNSVTGEVGYSYVLTSPIDNSLPADNLNKNDNFNIVTTDVEGQTVSATLAINILDDLPSANADTDEVINLGGGTADGNVFTGTGGTDSNNSDGSADLIGADGAVAGSPSPVTGVVAGVGVPSAANLGGAGVAGTYGNLVLNANGSYVYTPSTTNPAVLTLAPGATLADTFTYSIKDADGDTVSTTLTITIVGVPAVTGLGDGAVAGTDGSVLESDLASGTNAAGTGETLNGGFALNAPLGVQTLSIKPTGQAAVVLSLADLTALAVTPRTFTTANGTLTLTGFNVVTGQVDYTYTLTTPANSSGSPTDNFEVILRDNSPNGGVATAPQFLKIAIVDDAPIANPDTANINENSTNITGNVVTASDLIGADGPTGSNNPVTGVIAGTGTPTGSVGSAVAGSYGSITLAANGGYTYTLNNANATVNALNVGQSLTETFTYKITDKDGDVSTTTLTITIDGTNDAPVVNPDTATTLEDTPVSGNVLTNDSDVDSTLTLTQFTIAGVVGTFNAGDTATIPGVGTLTIGATGGYTFTPVAGYNGTVPVATYTVNDGSGQPNATAQNTLSLTVTSVNDAPEGGNSTVTTLEDTPVSLNAGNFGFTDPNDTSANALQSVIITTLPTAGTLKLNGVNVTAGQVITAANLANLTFTPPLNGFGTAISSMTFQVVDNGGTANGGQNTDQSPNTMTFDVTSVNDAPAGADKTVTINEDQAYLVTAADFGFTDANDSPANNLANIIITALPPSTQGVYLLNGNPVSLGDVISAADINSGLFTFNPAANLNGSNLGALGFRVQDDGGTANGGVNTDPTANTLKFNITAVNDVPVANDDNVTTNEDTPATLNLLGNDTDADGDTLSIKSINGVAITPGTAQTITVPNGQVNVSAAGVVTFVPNPNYFGPVTFDYVVQDGKGGEDTGTVNVTVASVNDKPTPAVDVTSTPEDTPVTGNVLSNDTDADGDTLNVTQFVVNGVTVIVPAGAVGGSTSLAGVGTINIKADGSYTFTPALNFNGALPVVTYTVTDSSGAANQTATSTLSLTVTPVNDAPVATPLNPSGNEDTPIAVNLAGTDVDGTVVSVTVTALPPVTEGILYLADGTTPVDIGSPLTPAQAAGLIFKPAPNFNGTVTPITFTVKDNQGLDSTPASANITIAPVIDLPVAISGSTNTPEDTNATVNLTATDVDGSIASIKVTVLPTPAEGVLYYADGITPVLTTDVISPADAATLVFVPTTNFNGLVNVKFTALDNDGNLSGNVGNFLIDVADVNDAPIATPVTVNGTEDVTAGVSLKGTDIDGTVTKITVDTLPPVTEGILYLADGVTPVVAGQPLTPAQAASLKFDPAPNFNGTVTIPFTVTDDDNELSTPANLIINIGAVNDAPDANPDTQTVAEDTPASGNVIANDTDAEGSALNVTQFNVPGVGTVTAGTTATIQGVGTILITANGNYTFTPVLNFNGNVPQITYTVSDGVNATNTTLNITVTSVNDAPVALATSPTGNEDTPIPVKLLGTDVDGSIASVTITSLPPATDGILTFANGTPVPVGTAITPAQAAGLIFVPAQNFNGTVTISFTVTDNQGATSSTADAVITVVPVNDPPVATPTIVTGNEDSPIALNLTGTDVEAPIASVTITSLPPATQGILTKADGSPVVAGVPLTPAEAAGLIFTPAPNFNGTLNIPFKVTDADGVSSPSTNATLNVVSVNDPPVAIASSVNTAEDTNVAVNLKGTDVDGTVASITVTSLPTASQGVLTFANGTPVIANVPMTPAQAAGLIFNPAANYNGITTILFTATDNVGAVSTPASFVIDVAAVDDDPIATPTNLSGLEDTPLPVSLTGTDVEGPITAVTVVSLPPASQGILTKADGTPVVAGQPLTPTEAANLIFVPAPNFNGSVNIPFTVTDSVGQVSSPPTIAALTIGAVNDVPVAIPSTPSGNEDTPIPVRLTGTDIDGTVTKVTIVTPPSNGTLTLNGVPVIAGQELTPAQAASLVFNPAPNFVGSVDVVFTVTDNNNSESPQATTTITVNDVVSPPVGNGTTVGGSSEDKIAVPLGGSDADGRIVSVTVQSLPPTSLGILTLADGTPVVAGVPLTPAQAAGLIFTPAPGANGTVNIVFTVTDDEGLVSAPAGASILIQDVAVLFEQLVAPPAKLNFDDPNRPDPFAVYSPVIPIGMPEDLFVTNSVRESAMRIAQSSNFGVFNVDAPTRGELDNLTFDLKGLPVGMDPTLFVQHAVRSLPITQQPMLFVQNAVRQSQLESTLRNIGTNSFNTATNGVLSLLSPFDLGSTNGAADLSVDAVQGEFVEPETQVIQVVDEKQAQNTTPEKDLTVLERQKVEVNKTLSTKAMSQKVAAEGFAQQLSAAAKRLKTTDVLNKHISN